MSYLNLTEINDIITGCTTEKPSRAQKPLCVQSGIVSLDTILGGGFPFGFVEISGEPSTGKTALAAHIVAYQQRTGKCGIGWVRSEQLDKDYLRRLGVDLDDLPLLDPHVVPEFLRDFDRALVVVDSLSALSPKDKLHRVTDPNHDADLFEWLLELQESMGIAHCVVCTSHVRANRSVDPNRLYTSGVRSAHRRYEDFFSGRVQLLRESVQDHQFTLVINVLTNTLAKPARYTKVLLRKGLGVDRSLDLARVAVSLGIIDQRGSLFYFDSALAARGMDSLVKELRWNPSFEVEVLRRVLAVG